MSLGQMLNLYQGPEKHQEQSPARECMSLFLRTLLQLSYLRFPETPHGILSTRLNLELLDPGESSFPQSLGLLQSLF